MSSMSSSSKFPSMKECNDAVLNFMKKANRPYDLNGICNKMGTTQFDKAAILKSLSHLCIMNEIQDKTYAKAKIYCVFQKTVDKDLEREEAREHNTKIAQVQQQLAECKKELAATEAELKKLQPPVVSLEDTLDQCATMKKIVEGLEVEVDKIPFCDVKKLSEAEQEKINKDHEFYTREYFKRKRKCNEMLDEILEGYPDNKKKLIEDIQLDTDEDYNFVPPKR